MSHISFYPGPSRVYSNTTEFIYEAYASGILFANHRSETFMNLMAKAKKVLHEKLKIPSNYEVAFVSSATECWEIISQSLVKETITIAYNGAFGRKWAGYASGISPNTHEVEFGIEEELPVDKIVDHPSEVVGIVHNETSNGSYISDQSMKDLRTKVGSETIIAVDATSSMAGIKLDWDLADFWFASVQKCFGLPAGMAVVIISPRAVEKAYAIGNHKPYNSLMRIVENSKKNQTHYTPNILNIYLMYRTQIMSKGIDHQHSKTLRRLANWTALIDQLHDINWLIKHEALRSPTVLTLRVKNSEELKKIAFEKGLILGNGYGDWKESTIRIANFPALKGKEIEKLAKFLKRYHF
jgi:phosphoserine aminotransferase